MHGARYLAEPPVGHSGLIIGAVGQLVPDVALELSLVFCYILRYLRPHARAANLLTHGGPRLNFITSPHHKFGCKLVWLYHHCSSTACFEYLASRRGVSRSAECLAREQLSSQAAMSSIRRL